MSINLSDKIKSNTAKLHESYNSLNEGQVRFKPADNCWSVLECLEHIYLIDKAVLAALTGITHENIPDNVRTELFGPEKLDKLLVKGRSFKVPAPDFVKPTGKFTNIADAAQHLDSVTKRVIEHINSYPVEQDVRTYKHPILGYMTPTDWVHFLVSHTERHIHQIEELKANALFPA
ncbi:MAG: DinB family protein [Bacteroidia bacterium]